ncbi:CDP-glycerol glycerophosphotransferase family protein [Lysobacter sp. A03]|uniref:CDP-glycerol glycerophosphotransferase family protein n=1 Tax=Lysobacter sp. A03 TaxID=1199154 RepID=UPI0005B6A9DE|nr:CDP-glycerol glycerophosphotransferase family protein [Lysobacter sp. A03]KIQ97617.1 CDP-glycerol: N-acetyl-beta-D-mannosaminyl-1,4-N-acetyl-D- glucosaminyldiphosphoundecaprenyl glycerophosphotransferase [Lysobacter sp. A03]
MTGPESVRGGVSGLIHRTRSLLGRKAGAGNLSREVSILDASGLFDRHAYLQMYPDVAASDMDPIEHYIMHGVEEGRNPSMWFDTSFYLAEYPDVASSGMNPLRHFHEHGWREWRNPSPMFDMRRYAKEHMVDGVGEVNPLLHRINNSIDDSDVQERVRDYDVVRASRLFDGQYYLQQYPDVAKAALDPLAHYIECGANEGRRASAWFDTAYYQKAYPDVLASAINPLRHFCEFGWGELRNPSSAFDTAWYWTTHMARSGDRGNPLVHFVETGLATGLKPRAVGKLSPQDKQEMISIAQQLVAAGELDIETYQLAGQVLAKLKSWPAAETAFREIVGLQWDFASNHSRLGHALAQQGKWWQVVESLLVATTQDPSRADWFHKLGEAQEKMHRFGSAADAYQRAADIEPANRESWYRLGYAYEKSGRQSLADNAYEKAIRLNRDLDAGKFGVGVLHQERGYWKDAAEAYQKLAKARPSDSGLRFRQGMAHDRCYEWDKAIGCYEKAIALSPRIPYWHYRLGFVLERIGRIEAAADAYGHAIELSPKLMSYWCYRQGYVLDMAGQYAQACKAYFASTQDSQEPSTVSPVYEQGDASGVNARSLAPRSEYFSRFTQALEEILDADGTCAETHYALGAQHEQAGSWELAATSYGNATARSDKHRPNWYYRLGTALYQAGRVKEACAAFRETRVLKQPYGVDISAFQKHAEQSTLAAYLEYTRTLPIQRRTIVYESFNGASMGSNPYAIFMELIDRPDFSGWTHVWALKDKNSVPAHIRARQNVVLVSRQSDLYRRYLATAQYLINDVTFPYWFVRRPEQRYLNTWHGTPLKCLGKHMPGEFLSHSNIARNLLQATHLISPNRHTTNVLLEGYDISGICNAKLAETGYPRIDRMLQMDAGSKERLKQRLGLDDGRPVVLYAPTWRGLHGAPGFDVERLVGDLSAMAQLPCQLVFRGHQLVESAVSKTDLPAILAPQNIDTGELLAVTDVLVTDYSSILFDFLPAERPIICYAYDAEEYQKERGLYFELDELPGTVCCTTESLVEALAHEIRKPDGKSERYKAAREKFSPHEDGEATNRTIEFFFQDSTSSVVSTVADTRSSILFYEGQFIPNGITSSFLNLMKELSISNCYRVAIAADPGLIAADERRKEKFSQLPDNVQVIGRVGRMILDPEESWLVRRFGALHDVEVPEMKAILAGAYQREYLRIFSDAKFDALVNFEGYSSFWMQTLAFAPAGPRRVSYLHNDMRSEQAVRLPYLSTIFPIYRNYDALVSVSEDMSRTNCESLSESVGIPANKFVACINSIDVESIRSLALQEPPEELERWFTGKTFVTIGRMSPEKDHSKLIDAFAGIHREFPDARLLIIGDGPLRNELEVQIASMGMKDVVLLAGQHSNPFPILRRSDCFVLSSNHEGQPMVLLEAMVLGKPIVATDISGNRGVLKDGHGVLVDNSSEGLREGMLLFMCNPAKVKPFDAAGYQADARRMFSEVVLGVKQ